MRIPFDIKYRGNIESGEYKVFAHEHEEQEARIVCWDNKGKYPIVALVDNEPEKFDKYGRVPGGNRGGEFSLFIVTPEPEPLTKLEKAVFDMLVERTNEATISERQARKYAPIFLEIAKDEIYSYESLVEYAEKARAEGKAEALKDLPRWGKGSIEGDRIVGLSLYHNMKWISFSDLEKLPGFNDEDHE